ncbi:MAG: restriction endonuclease [Acidobacteria bacterium]|nr:restriction endonuclease [Acidobacteriota bacterium]
MASIHQVRGALLEETVLMLLRAAGYRTVSEPGVDPTLGMVAAGLTVAGRGARHQIDAVADFRLGQPFSNPQRLLVETKSYRDDRPIGLPIVRGTVGVIKDVSEYWVARDARHPAPARYHYQGAIFSSSPFTADAQDYAFAHDVYLLPLARSSNFAPILRSIEAATDGLTLRADGQVAEITVSEVRRELRRRLQPDVVPPGGAARFPWLDPVAASTRQIGQALVATIGQAFPVFLVPRPGLDLERLPALERVEIYLPEEHNAQGWSVHQSGQREPIFTFDLPEQLFALYADEGVLSRRAAADLKATYLSELTAVYAPGDQIKVFNFRLDDDWLGRVRERIGTREEPR